MAAGNRDVGIGTHALATPQDFPDDVNSAEEHDVGFGADGAYTSATEAEREERGSTTMRRALLCAFASVTRFEAAGVSLGRIAAHDQDQVGVLDVEQVTAQ